MLICATSDLHGYLPEIPDCNVLVIAGDIGLGQRLDSEHWRVEAAWWERKFRPWLMELMDRSIVVLGVAGNHDFICEDAGGRAYMGTLPWIYLQDESVTLGGVKFHGTPWQSWYSGWAFNAPEVDPGEEFLREKFALIPDDCDVLIAHSPPMGFHDRVGHRHTGSSALNRRIHEVAPTLAVYGHVHHGYGVEQVEGVTLANVSHTSVIKGDYVPDNPPILFEI